MWLDPRFWLAVIGSLAIGVVAGQWQAKAQEHERRSQEAAQRQALVEAAKATAAHKEEILRDQIAQIQAQHAASLGQRDALIGRLRLERLCRPAVPADPAAAARSDGPRADAGGVRDAAERDFRRLMAEVYDSLATAAAAQAYLQSLPKEPS